VVIRARLIDLEGVTVCEIALPDPPEQPRWYIYAASIPKIAAMVEPEDPIELSVKRIEYRLERRDGGGTYIYRRVTPPWG
jgi:hypothetical protein